MLTTLKLRRLWTAGRYRALIRDLTAGRPEARLELDATVGGPTVAAALGLIRLVELGQARMPLAGELAARLRWGQRRDGSWGDAGDDGDAVLIKTALASRALDGHDAEAFARGISFLSAAQGVTGWGTCSATTAVVLMQVARLAGGSLRIGDALSAEPTCGGATEADARTRWAWKHARLRIGHITPARPLPLRKPAAQAEPSLAFAA